MGGDVGDWDASSGTGSGDACGGCEAVEDPIGVRELVIPRALAVTPLLINHYSYGLKLCGSTVSIEIIMPFLLLFYCLIFKFY